MGLFGGGGKPPVNVPDNLASKDRIEVVLGLCEGPIKGLANGDQSFYFDQTQYQAADGTYNYQLFSLDVDVGNTPAGQIIPVLGSQEYWRGLASGSGGVPVTSLGQSGVAITLAANNPTVFTTSDPNVTQLIIRLNVIKLFRTGTDAQINALPGAPASQSNYLPSSFQIEITYRQTGSGNSFQNPYGGPVTVNGRTGAGEYHELRFLVSGGGPYDVSVNLLTQDFPNARCLVNLDGYYEVSGGYYGLARSNNVNVLLTSMVPVTYTTQYPNANQNGVVGINAIKIRLLIAELYNTQPSGVYMSSAGFLIEYKPTSSSTWTTAFGGQQIVVGKTTSGSYVSEFLFTVPPIAGTYDVRLTQTNSIQQGDVQQIYWESFEEIVGGPAQFDGTATVHIIGQSSNQFSSAPQMWGIYDLKLCKIPSNYDPYAHTYTGTWDGTFKIDWTNNPAWCLYDLMMNSSYGAITYWPQINLDPYDTYNAGIWCDQMVPDGQGGLQPRYTFNGLISNQRSVRDQIRYMAGVFNGTLLDDLNGNIRLVWDSDDTAVALFTYENVLEPGFSYGYTDIQSRYNYLTVHFDDPNLYYKTRPLWIYDQSHINRFGKISLTFQAIGCTNAHEAVRRAAYKMLTATTETEIVSFTTNRQGMVLQPFDVILVGDPDMGNSITGRIRGTSVDRTEVFLRDPVYLEQGILYTFYTHIPNPNYPAESNPLTLVEIPFWSQATGEVLAFQLSAALPAAVADQAQFSLGADGSASGVPKPYRITKIEEVDGDADHITIEAIEINRNKWTLADNATDVNGLSYLNMPANIAPPTKLTITTEITQINGLNISNIVATWVVSSDARVNDYLFQYRRTGEKTWNSINVTSRARADIYDVSDGTYDFRVQAIASDTLKSVWLELDGVAAGNSVPPDDVQNMAVSIVGNHLSLSWLPVAARNLAFYWLRHSPLTDGTATWDKAADLIPQLTATNVAVPIQAGTYFVKAVNVAGVTSTNAAYVITTAVANGKIADFAQQTGIWGGTKTNLTSWNNLSLNTNGALSGTYTWESGDLGSSKTVTINISSVLGAVDNSVNPPVVAPAGSWTYGLQIAISTDGTTFGSPKAFVAGSYTGRRFQFILTLTTTASRYAPTCYQLSADIEGIENTEQSFSFPGAGTNMLRGVNNNIALNTNLSTTASYVWETVDLGQVLAANITLALIITAQLLNDTMAAWATLQDVSSLSGAPPGTWSYGVLIAASTDGTNFGTPTPFTPGTYTGRRFQFTINLASLQTGVVPFIEQCDSTVTLPARYEFGSSVVATSAGLAIAFSDLFDAAPALLITNKTAAAGDYYTITNETTTGFTITFYNSASTAVTRTFDWQATGYGGSK